ncbi:MAG TPA: response regulator [Geobacteraceae bacterium]|nr:response regulator [Geobacteraceae bacterium]
MGTAPEEMTVLLVEDNQDDVKLARWALQKMGITRVVVARDGCEALAMLLDPELLPSLPDFILLDLRLPKLDGIAVLQQLRADERTRQLRVIILTSSEDPRDQEACRDLGAVAFLSKPLKGKVLLDYLP